MRTRVWALIIASLAFAGITDVSMAAEESACETACKKPYRECCEAEGIKFDYVCFAQWNFDTCYQYLGGTLSRCLAKCPKDKTEDKTPPR
jgi:hypothetical protein